MWTRRSSGFHILLLIYETTLSLSMSFSNASVTTSRSHLILLSLQLVLPLNLQNAWYLHLAHAVSFSGVSTGESLIMIHCIKLHSIFLFDTFLKKEFCWSMVNSQGCDHFCCRTKRSSHTYTHIHSLWFFSHIDYHRILGRVLSAIQQVQAPSSVLGTTWLLSM